MIIRQKSLTTSLVLEGSKYAYRISGIALKI